MKFILLTFGLISSILLTAQDLNYAKTVVKTLASPEMEGRGYVNNGDKKAADFIASEFSKHQLKSFGTDYFQLLSFPMNTITSDNGISIDNKVLKAGKEYLIDPANKGIKGSFEIVFLPDSLFDKKEELKKFFSQNLKNKFILTEGRFSKLKKSNDIKAKGIIYINHSKLVWHASGAEKARKFVVIEVLDSAISTQSKTISLNFENKFLKKHQTQNVIAYVEGYKYPDKYYVFTAHYDHLGRMGQDVYFPGANDNASGIAMMLDFANYYSKAENKPEYSIIFIALCGEETGLKGSLYCAQNPPFELKNVKFLINLDMVGTGSEGITVVNATVFKKAFELMKEINYKKNYLAKVNAREESCNSDHCPFYMRGVPSVFIYSLGKEYLEYHNPDDKSENLPFTDYEDIFRLLRDFLNTY